MARRSIIANGVTVGIERQHRRHRRVRRADDEQRREVGDDHEHHRRLQHALRVLEIGTRRAERLEDRAEHQRRADQEQQEPADEPGLIEIGPAHLRSARRRRRRGRRTPAGTTPRRRRAACPPATGTRVTDPSSTSLILLIFSSMIVLIRCWPTDITAMNIRMRKKNGMPNRSISSTSVAVGHRAVCALLDQAERRDIGAAAVSCATSAGSTPARREAHLLNLVVHVVREPARQPRVRRVLRCSTGSATSTPGPSTSVGMSTNAKIVVLAHAVGQLDGQLIRRRARRDRRAREEVRPGRRAPSPDLAFCSAAAAA